MYLIYTLLYCAALVVVLPFEYFKRPRALRRRWLREKFGCVPASAKSGLPPSIWVHAVSVGEVMASLPLLARLRTAYPDHDLILSTITDTGQGVARHRVPEGVRTVYLPFDIPAIIRAVIRKAAPRLLVVIETELWPNLLRIFRENGTPVVLLNGRISEKSFRGYEKISFFMRRVLATVDSFGMQNGEYADRVRRLGAESGKIEVVGSFKFDADPPAQAPRWASRLGKPVIVAGSTHEGEEEVIASACVELRKELPGLTLIIAPRHPERFGAVADMLRSRGVTFVRRSEIDDGTNVGGMSGSVILLDSVGELSSVYGIASIAVIGKSFRGRGGQNPLEPAFWGVPIVCGPHMENFPVIRHFYAAGAAVEVTEATLASTLRELLRHPEKAEEIGRSARRLYQQNAGAVDKAMEIIRRSLDARS